jgi:hypothetical protein
MASKNHRKTAPVSDVSDVSLLGEGGGDGNGCGIRSDIDAVFEELVERGDHPSTAQAPRGARQGADPRDLVAGYLGWG